MDRIRRWLYCRRGYHRLRPESLRIEKWVLGGKNRCTLNAKWLECHICGRLFFNTKEERDKYAKYQERRDKQMKKALAMSIEEFKKEQNIRG